MSMQPPLGHGPRPPQPPPAGYSPIDAPKRRGGSSLALLLGIVLLGTVAGIAVAVRASMMGGEGVSRTDELLDPRLSASDRKELGLGDDAGFLYQGGAARAVVMALDDAIPGAPTRFTEVSVYGDYATAIAQDPTRPERMDRYIWRAGNVEPPAPQPDKAGIAGFTLDEINWEAITALAAEAPRLSDVEAGEVSYVIVQHNTFVDDGSVVVRIFVKGPRGTAVVEATADGEFVKTF